MDKNNAKLLKTTTFSLVILPKHQELVCHYFNRYYLYDLFYREMATHKLDLGDFDEVDYYLIAIHTSLEDRLAYFINQQLPINLSKSKDEVQISIKKEKLSLPFYYYDNENAVSWNLIQNKKRSPFKKRKMVFKNFGCTNGNLNKGVFTSEFKKSRLFF
jgi:hypothetical protein